MRKNSHFIGQPLYGLVIKNPNLGDAYRKSAAHGYAEGSETAIELLRTSYYG